VHAKLRLVGGSGAWGLGGKRPLRRPMRGWEDNLKINFQDV